MSSSREPGKRIPSGLWKQLAEWRFAYVGGGGHPAPAPGNGANGTTSSHHSVLVPIESGLGSFPICLECGEALLPGAQCTHGPRGRDAMEHEDQAVSGRLLGGRWRVLEPVGGGSFGTFWKGEHHILEMKVGIKVLRRYLTATPAGLKRFHQEAMRVSQLHHPGIVKLFDYGQEEDGTPYLVMEYLRGTPLSSYIQEKSLDLDDYVEIVSQVTRALIPAHRGEFTGGDPLVHLDLKPEHIFVERIEDGWHVKIIDFGLAEITGGRREETGLAGGTPLYMGPERFRGIVDPRSDLYSIGVILYECVAGRRPFEGNHLSEIREAHESQAPAPPRRKQTHPGKRQGGSSSRKLDSLILSTLAKDLDGRPRNAEELLERLESWKRLRADERDPRRWGRRAARLGAVSLGAMATLLFVLWWAPGASLRFNDPLPEKVTLPQKPTTHPGGTVTGFMFAGAPVLLDVEAEGKQAQIEVGRVNESGEFQMHWPNKEELESRLGRDRARDGAILQGTFISRRMRRTVSGRTHRIELDYKDPEISEIQDASDARLHDIQRDDVLYILIPSGQKELDCKKITVVASEDLNLGACSVDGKTVTQKEEQSQDRFILDTERRGVPIVCRLVDLPGNAVDRNVLLVEGVSIKEQVKRHLTNHKEYPINVRVYGHLGHVRVLLDGKIAKDDPEQDGLCSRERTVRFTVPFEMKPGQRESRSVTFQAWSILGDVAGKPEAELTVILERFERPLMVKNTNSSEGIPRFRVLDSSTGVEEDRSHIEVEIAGVQGKIPCKDGVPVIPEGLRGKLSGTCMARDDHGNESVRVPFSLFHPSRPRIQSVEIAGGHGSAEQPLHLSDCMCSWSSAEDREFVIETAVDYAHPDDLEWEVQAGKLTLPFVRKGNSLALSRSELLRHLEIGENRLQIVVFDNKDPARPRDLVATQDVFVHVDRVEPTVYPPDLALAQIDAEGRVELQIDVGTARVESVFVTLEEEDGAKQREAVLPNGPKGVYTHKHRASLRHHGYTSFIVEIQAGGMRHEVRRRYHRLPVERLVYVFHVGDKPLQLEFQKRRGEGKNFGGMWFTSAVPDPMSRVKAEAVLVAVENLLRSEGMIGPDRSTKMVRFPKLEEFESLLEQKLIEPKDGHLEWLEGLEDSGRAPFTEMVAGAPVPGSARYDPAQRAAFRVIIEYGAEGSRLEPRYSAAGVRRR